MRNDENESFVWRRMKMKMKQLTESAHVFIHFIKTVALKIIQSLWEKESLLLLNPFVPDICFIFF